ncbi:MAG: hypothetical protein HC915_06405 [Anaerolineae bacterium]|nr:hypothetical protein [Anaerolineae bacterium]
MQRTILIFALASLLTGWLPRPLSGWAQTAPATLTVLQGTVEVAAPGETFAPVTESVSLEEGYQIRWEEDALGEAIFFNGLRILIDAELYGPGSFSIQQLMEDDPVINLTQLTGNVLYSLENTLETETVVNVRDATGTATASIRGTDFRMEVVAGALVGAAWSNDAIGDLTFSNGLFVDLTAPDTDGDGVEDYLDPNPTEANAADAAFYTAVSAASPSEAAELVEAAGAVNPDLIVAIAGAGAAANPAAAAEITVAALDQAPLLTLEIVASVIRNTNNPADLEASAALAGEVVASALQANPDLAETIIEVALQTNPFAAAEIAGAVARSNPDLLAFVTEAALAINPAASADIVAAVVPFAADADAVLAIVLLALAVDPASAVEIAVAAATQSAFDVIEAVGVAAALAHPSARDAIGAALANATGTDIQAALVEAVSDDAVANAVPPVELARLEPELENAIFFGETASGNIVINITAGGAVLDFTRLLASGLLFAIRVGGIEAEVSGGLFFVTLAPPINPDGTRGLVSFAWADAEGFISLGGITIDVSSAARVTLLDLGSATLPPTLSIDAGQLVITESTAETILRAGNSVIVVPPGVQVTVGVLENGDVIVQVISAPPGVTVEVTNLANGEVVELIGNTQGVFDEDGDVQVVVSGIG